MAYVLTNVLKKKDFIRCVFQRSGEKVRIDFSPKYGQYSILKGEIGDCFDEEWVHRYNSTRRS